MNVPAPVVHPQQPVDIRGKTKRTSQGSLFTELMNMRLGTVQVGYSG